jgi:hypothetical protein
VSSRPSTIIQRCQPLASLIYIDHTPLLSKGWLYILYFKVSVLRILGLNEWWCATKLQFPSMAISRYFNADEEDEQVISELNDTMEVEYTNRLDVMIKEDQASTAPSHPQELEQRLARFDCLRDPEYLAIEMEMDEYMGKRTPDQKAPTSGFSSDYPHLFIPSPDLVASLNVASLLYQLPAELRLEIYKYLLSTMENEIVHSEFKDICETCALDDGDSGGNYYTSSLNRCGPEHRPSNPWSIELSRDNEDLKFWLSTPILQTCRLFRYEGLHVLFEIRMVSASWWPCIISFQQFMGPAGCRMIREFEIRDEFNHVNHPLKEFLWPALDEFNFTVGVFQSLKTFPNLQYLRLDLEAADILDINDLHELQNKDSQYSASLNICNDKLAPLEEILARNEFKVLASLKLKSFDLFMDFENKHWEINWYDSIQTEKLIRNIPVQIHKALIKEMCSQEAEGSSEISLISNTSSTPLKRLELELPEHEASETDSENSTCLHLPIFNYIHHITQEYHDPLRIKHLFGLDDLLTIEIFLKTYQPALRSIGEPVPTCAVCYYSQSHCGYHRLPPLPINGKPQDPIDSDVPIMKMLIREVLLPTELDYFRNLITVQRYLAGPRWLQERCGRECDLFSQVLDDEIAKKCYNSSFVLDV